MHLPRTPWCALGLVFLACGGSGDDASNDAADPSSDAATDGSSSVDTASPSDGAPSTDTGPLQDGAMPDVHHDPPPCVDAGTCPAGVWTSRSLPGLASPDTVQTVLVDPVRPSDYYAFAGSNGGPTIKVYRSTDFGDTWVDVNTTAGITGNPWGASIDSNPARDPGTIPTMWAPSGYGAVGAWKSTDGGVTWKRSAAADKAFGTYNPFGATLTDLYHIRILPDDPPNHVLATYHYYFKDIPDGGFGETWDGGTTWVVHPPPTGIGTSHYVIPISGTTWAVIAQDNGGANGIWRTTTAGRVGGTEAAKFRDGTISSAAWTKVDTLEHCHGSHENVILKDGTIFATGCTNGARSTDHGATWTHFTATGSWSPPHQFEQSDMSNLAVTERFIYTNFLSGSPQLRRAPIADPIGGEKWSFDYAATPPDMHEGGAPFGMASSFDASRGEWVIVAGTIGSGLWKYVEPK